jgi:ribose transport system ATP-binding protein
VSDEVSLLSGGNQQKVVIGKGLYTDGQVYIFQEPTVGVDVGAKAGIYEMIRELSADKAIIVVGSDCEEVYGLCDHAMVMHQGRVVMDQPADQVQLEQMLLRGLTGEAGQ